MINMNAYISCTILVLLLSSGPHGSCLAEKRVKNILLSTEQKEIERPKEVDICISTACFRFKKSDMPMDTPFLLIYQFQLNEEYHPELIAVIDDSYHNVNEVKSCMSKWIFKGINDTKSRLTCAINWEPSSELASITIYNSTLCLQIKHKINKENEDIKICGISRGFPVPDFWRQANASFAVSYQFSLDDEFHPKDIRIMHDPYLDTSIVIPYIRKWKISGIAKSSRYTCLANLEHIYGWTSITIYSDQMFLQINNIE